MIGFDKGVFSFEEVVGVPLGPGVGEPRSRENEDEVRAQPHFYKYCPVKKIII